MRGFVIPVLLSLEAVRHLAAYHENGIISLDWVISVSKNGWSINEIGL
jgi:hypothetical protein